MSDKSDRSDRADQPSKPGKSDLVLKLLALYRFRREENIDAIVDQLFPELAGTDEE